jgi:hypothetical protein
MDPTHEANPSQTDADHSETPRNQTAPTSYRLARLRKHFAFGFSSIERDQRAAGAGNDLAKKGHHRRFVESHGSGVASV